MHDLGRYMNTVLGHFTRWFNSPQMWEMFSHRYVHGGLIDGQDFQLLPADAAEEIAASPSAAVRARLVCDFLADMTDGHAACICKRLFTPDFGSVGDLVGECRGRRDLPGNCRKAKDWDI